MADGMRAGASWCWQARQAAADGPHALQARGKLERMTDAHDIVFGEEHVQDCLIAGTAPDVAASYRALPKIAATEAFSLVDDDVIVLDTETTGLDANRCRLIEIAAARLRGNTIVDTFETFVDPGCSIPAEIVSLTGITEADVAEAPTPQQAVSDLAEFVGTCDLVAHNAEFDRAFIMRAARPSMLPGAWVDTLALAQIILPRMKAHRLADLSRAFGTHASSHRALDDVFALAGVWRVLLAQLKSLEPGLCATIAQLSPSTPWILRPYFQAAAGAHHGVDFSLRTSRSKRCSQSTLAERTDAAEVPTRFRSTQEIEEAFSPNGLAGKMYPNYEQRDEQVAMATQVGEALRMGDFRILEAATGVGKSMAYLLPSVLGARDNAITIGIATKTNTLMDQLVYRELPRLCEALGAVSYVALKGYEHYICLRKLEHEVRSSSDDPVAVIQMLATLCTFVSQTSWGDIDALNMHWQGLPRASVQANSNDCLKKRCPYFFRLCYLHGARRRAQCADVVVTNHALLFRDIQMENGILPPIRHWIIDEAHAVESEARRQLSHSISTQGLSALFDRLCSPFSGIIAHIRQQAPKLEGGDILYGVTADVDARVEQLRALQTSFFSYVKELGGTPASSPYASETLWIGEELRESAAWHALEGPGRSLVDKLGGLHKRLGYLLSTIEQFEGAFDTQRADLSTSTSSLFEMTQALVMVLDGTDTSYVYSAQLSRDASAQAEVLIAERLDIGSVLADEFYPNVQSAVFTSATLATGDKDPFAHYLHVTGLSRLSENRVSAAQMESSYDFDNNMTIFLPQEMPEPDKPGYRETLANLLLAAHRAMGGSVLTLFTNRRDMETLYKLISPILADEGIEVLAQLRGMSTRALNDRFLADESLSLFALRSFWEGFDAPGDTLRCVVIPKLPFGRPNDPIALERNMREGKSAWRRYTLPEAVIDLKQAAGRLIRNSTDSGWLVLADARLQTRSYAKSFLRAMPTKDIRTASIDEIADAMRKGRR